MLKSFFSTILSPSLAPRKQGTELPASLPAIAGTRPCDDVQVALLSEAGGGVMRHVIDLHRGLLRRGWRSTLIVSPKRLDERYRHEIAAFEKGQIEFVELERAPHRSDVHAYHQVRSLLGKMSGRRILHAHSTKAGMLGSLLYPHVTAMAFTPHAFRATDPTLSPLQQRALRSVELTYSRPYDRIIAVSSSEHEYTLKCGIDDERVTCIPNGIHYEGRPTNHTRLERDLSHTVTLGFVGRLVHQKNPLLFIETLAYLAKAGHNVRAEIVGDGDLRPEMAALAQQLGVAGSINWRGDVPARELLGTMDVMVHTSLYEALPYSLLEACAEALPIVATENHGSLSVMRGEVSQNIVKPATAEALGRRVVRLLSDRVLWARQFDLLDQSAHYFSMDTMVSNMEQLYSDLLSSQYETAPSVRRNIRPTVSRIPAFL